MKNNKIKFISELASSHQGSVQDVIKLSKLHLKSRSDYVKYQIFKTKNLYQTNDKYFKIYKKIEINYQNWKKIINKFYNTISNYICTST